MEQQTEHNKQKNMGYSMIIAMWLVIFGLLAFLFRNVLQDQHNPNQHINTQLNDNNAHEVVLQRNHYGHYVASGKINNHDVTFMLDTGASDVSIPSSIAKEIGLKPGTKMYYQTANGKVAVYATHIDVISIGNIELANIRATINPNVEDMDVLLGMSFLKELEFSQRGNTLTLRQYPR